ncbi:MAG TPA: hypothetical protein VH561_05580 [Micromonosporaceae bacterium]|jgi:hypothetical protein
MPELPEPAADQTPGVDLVARIRATAGLAPLVAEAQRTWLDRAAAAGQQPAEGSEDVPAWRAFSDAFPTFWEFTNRPR